MLIEDITISASSKPALTPAHNFLLSESDAHSLFRHLTETIEQHWDTVCEEAQLSKVDKKLFWKRRFLNPYSMVIEWPLSFSVIYKTMEMQHA